MWPTRNGEINCGKQGYCGKYRATINFPVSDESFVRFGPFSDSQIMNMYCDSWDMLDQIDGIGSTGGGEGGVGF